MGTRRTAVESDAIVGIIDSFTRVVLIRYTYNLVLLHLLWLGADLPSDIWPILVIDWAVRAIGVVYKSTVSGNALVHSASYVVSLRGDAITEIIEVATRLVPITCASRSVVIATLDGASAISVLWAQTCLKEEEALLLDEHHHHVYCLQHSLYS